MKRGCLHISYNIETASYTQTLSKKVDGDSFTELKKEIRERPKHVFAILSSYHTHDQQPCSNCPRKDVHGTHHSIAFWSPSWSYYDGYHPDELLHDYYRPGTQSGHLIADSCGGPRCCKNLVPMRTEMNLSLWKTQFENKLSDAPGFSVCKITCTYSDGLDPRIPTRVSGQSINFTLSDVFPNTMGTPSKDSVGLWLKQNAQNIETNFSLYYVFPSLLHQKIYTALKGPNVTTIPFSSRFSTHHGGSSQSVMIPKDITVTVDSNKLWSLLDKYYNKRRAVEGSGPLGLTQFNDEMIRTFKGVKKSKKVDRKYLYSLPPRHKRPYEILDYLALNGLLDSCVKNENGYYISIDSKYLIDNFRKDSFTQEMKALIVVTNQWLLRRREAHRWNDLKAPTDWQSLQGNIYRSDAKGAGDPGDIGDGIVLDPQIDHIAPVSPASGPIKPRRKRHHYSPYARPYSIAEEPTMTWGFYPGPSIFSNAQLTSGQYNNNKRNKYFDDNLVLVYAKELPNDEEIDFTGSDYLFKAKNNIFEKIDEELGAVKK